MSKSQSNWVIVLLVFLVLLSTLDLLGKPFGASQDWEYRIVSPDDRNFIVEMNKFGHDGWELVSARRASDSSGDMAYEMIMKRPSGLSFGVE